MQQQERGKYIQVEGMDGSGKSTVVEAIVAWLTEQGIEHIVVQEPGSTPLGAELRNIVKDAGYPIDDVAEAMLFAAARRQVWVSVVKPALERGVTVVTDRGLLSSYAYQGGGRDCYEQVLDLASITFGGRQQIYDLSIYLDIDVETAIARSKLRGMLDRIEKAGPTFFAEVREYYHDIFKHTEVREYLDKVTKVDATQSKEEVAHAAVSALKDLFEQEE